MQFSQTIAECADKIAHGTDEERHLALAILNMILPAKKPARRRKPSA
jgi:hypothetical protein